METRDQAPLQDVNQDVPPAAAPLPPPAPRRPLAVPAAVAKPPTFWSVMRAVLFVALSAGALLLAGRRWADAFARYQSFHASEPATLSFVAPAAPAPAPAVDEPALKQPRDVLFRLDAPSAKAVLLGGSFNGFNARENPLTRRTDGSWETTLTLPPGRYTYKFKVDGRWTLDPANPERLTGAREASVLDIQ